MRFVGPKARAAIGLAAGAVLTAQASAESLRDSGPPLVSLCGWFSNPTPGNAFLHAKEGIWTIAEQGAYEAKGDWPIFQSRQRVSRSLGNYGFGCACLSASVDRDAMTVIEIRSANAKPLSECRKDAELRQIEKRLR